MSARHSNRTHGSAPAFRHALAIASCAAAFSTAARAQCPGWSSSFGPPTSGDGVNARVYDMTVFDDQLGTGRVLVAGGDFTQCGTAAVGHIAKWNGSSWAALGTGVGTNGTVFGLAAFSELIGISTPGPEVYAGGSFTSIDSLGAQHVAVWDDTFVTWEPLTDTGTNIDGVDGDVYVVAIHGTGANATLVVGGRFGNAGGHAANNIAMWDGSVWSALGTNVGGGGTAGGFIPGRVDALCSYGGVLYAGGWFASADGTAANLVAKWDGSTWSAVGAGLFGNNVYDLIVYDDDGFGAHNPALYAGGQFAVTNGGPTVNVAKWNGTAWTAVGGGLDNAVRDLEPHFGACGPSLIATGHFHQTGATGGNLVSRFDGTAWRPIAGGLSAGSNFATCAASFGVPGELRDVVVGGAFTQADGQASNDIALACPCDPPLSMDEGKTVVTSEGLLNSDFVVTLLETRGPRATTDTNWNAPKFHNEFSPSAPSHVWNLENIGEVFGVCLDDALPPNIYVAATTVYDTDIVGPSGPGAVYKIDGATGDVSEFCSTWPYPTLACVNNGTFTTCPFSNDLPNTGPGLGDICFDVQRHVFYVSNFEDGKIYVLDMSGNRLQAWDPFVPDDGTAGFAPRGERVWAVQSVRRFLMFSVWLCDAGNPPTIYPPAWPTNFGTASPNNAIFSVSIGNGGLLLGVPSLRRLMGYFPGEVYSNPVSDIAVSPDMEWTGPIGVTFLLLAERAMLDDTTPDAHKARVLEWKLKDASLREWFTGEYDSHRNSTGGADFNCDWEVLVTGDYIKDTNDGVVYGVQINPRSGNVQYPNSTLNSWLIDLNGILGTQDKTRTGDLEVVRHCWGTQFPHGGF